MNQINFSAGQLRLLFNRKLHSLLLDESSYIGNWRSPTDFVVASRIDLLAKIAFARSYISGLGREQTKRIYLEHIACINGFFERDGSGKSGPMQFVTRFEQLIDSIQSTGFDPSNPIPVYGNEILDGAHRVAACVALDIPVLTVDLPHPGHTLGADYFASNGMDSETLDHLLVEFVRSERRIRFALLWAPIADQSDAVNSVISGFADIAFRKHLDLTERGCVNAIILAYSTEPWLGNSDNRYLGAHSKAASCFQSSRSLEVVALIPKGDMVEMKEEVRKVRAIGKHSIHVNDTHEESLELAQCFFNKNSLHLLNSATQSSHQRFDSLFRTLTSVAKKASIDPNDFCIDGGSTLAVYGVRDCGDLDFLTPSETTRAILSSTGNDLIECHNHKHVDLGFDVDETVFNPRNHFFHKGFKFIAIDQLLEKKKRRRSAGDIRDLELCAKLSGRESFKDRAHLMLTKLRSPRYIYRRTQGLLLGAVSSLRRVR